MADGGHALSTVFGVSVGSIITAAGVWAAVIALVRVMWMQRVPMRKMKLDADVKLIDTLGARVELLERKLDEKDAKHEAEVSMLRHQIVNSDQCLDLLLALLEEVNDLPERAKSAVQKTKAMRREQRDRETVEKATLRGSAMAATRLPPPSNAS